jgi:hypothetical protein
MSQKKNSVAAVVNLKVERLCGIDEFVSSVDRRTKHASGLAIHHLTSDLMLEAPVFVSRPPPPKTKFYLQAEQEMKNKGQPDPVLIENLKRRKAAARELEGRLRSFQNIGAKKIQSHLNEIDIPPDPDAMARFRFTSVLGVSHNYLLKETDDGKYVK